MADTLEDIARSHEVVLRNFRGLEQKLEAALAPHASAADAAARVMGCVEEYGVDGALRRVADDPDQFGVRWTAEAQREIAPLLQALVNASGHLDRLLTQREKLLRAADPKRLPVYQVQGREFQVDARKGTMTFLDAPGQPVAVAMQVVHTKDQPNPGRRVPRRAKERGPER